MKKTMLFGVAMTLLVVGCGGSDNDRANTVTPQTSSSSAEAEPNEDTSSGALTKAQLDQALLTVPDLPTGYKLGTVTPDDDSPTESDNPECAARFDELDAVEDEAVAKAAAAFEGSGLGSILEQELSSFEDEDRLSEQIQTVTELLSECPTFKMTDADGVESTVNISPLSFPKLGDETLALSLGVETPDFDLTLNLVVIRVGSTLQLVSQGGLMADAAALEQAARKGTEKLESVS